MISGTLFNAEVPFVVLVPKPMPLGQEVLGAIRDAMIGRKVTCALIVFKHCGLNLGGLQRSVPILLVRTNPSLRRSALAGLTKEPVLS